MSEYQIPEVSSIPSVTQRSYNIERVHKAASGEYVSNWTTYTVTVYDHQGCLITTRTSNTVLGSA